MKIDWLFGIIVLATCAAIAVVACGDDDDGDDDDDDDVDDNESEYSCDESCTAGQTCGIFDIIGGGYDYDDCVNDCQTDGIDDCGMGCIAEYYETEDCAVMEPCMTACYGPPE